MKQTINFYDFERAFMERRPDNFSYEGLRVLFDWFCMMESDCETETELDVIAICCEFSESTYDDITEAYSIDEDSREMILAYLNDHTMVCGETEQGTIVYQSW